jgi:putative tryptophan/tyrosine transport system substrate-binding protein
MWQHQMRRHDVIALIGGGVATWPVEARSQQSRMPHIGVLWHAGSAEEEAIYLGAFVEGMNALGYIDGKTIALEHRFPNEIPERFRELAAELVALKPVVLVAVTRLAAVAARNATSTIPIVFVAVPDPVGTELVSSLARPGGNITGLTQISVELTAKRLELYKELFPAASRVALLVNANDPLSMHRYVEEFRSAAAKMKVAFQPIEVRSLGEFAQAFDKVSGEQLEAVFVAPDGLFYQGREQLAQLAVTRRLPFVVHSREMLDAGALVSYGPDLRVIFRRAATYIQKILKVEKPADLPVEQPTQFEFLLNLKTAKLLGLALPELILLRADGIVE